jgi:hypothetical protein
MFSLWNIKNKGKRYSTLKKNQAYWPYGMCLGDCSRFAAQPIQYRSNMSHKTQMPDTKAAEVNKSVALL